MSLLRLWVVRIFALVFVLFFSACSLDYGKDENTEASVPEFTFVGAHLVRVEAKKRTMQIDAEKLEQYKSDGSSYARGASFKTYDKDENIDTEGSCGLVALDINNERYKLFDGIAIHILSQEMRLYAQSLQFNGQTEQLTSGRDDIVSVEKKNATVSGKGFSASGVSRSFAFLSGVTGTADVEDKDAPADEDASDDAAADDTATDDAAADGGAHE